MASGLIDLLARHRTGLTEQDVVAALEAALTAAHDDGSAPLADSEIKYLRKHGGPGTSAALDNGVPVDLRRTSGDTAVDRVAQTIGSSYSLEEGAHLLGASRTTVSRWLRTGTLWSFTLGRRRRIPRWQLIPDGALLPGLAEIVPAIPAGIEPSTVEAFMSSPQHDLDDRSPLQYLAVGGDSREIAQLMADLGRW